MKETLEPGTSACRLAVSFAWTKMLERYVNFGCPAMPLGEVWEARDEEGWQVLGI